MGTAELSCASLESLARDEKFSVVAVVTQPDKPKGRDLKLQPSPVKSLALKLNLPVLQPARARDEAIYRRTARVAAGFDCRRRLRTHFAAGDFGVAAPRLPECPRVAPAEISRRGADPVGDCHWRNRNRRHGHENGRGPGHRPDCFAAAHADFAGRRFRHAARPAGAARRGIARANHSRFCRRKNPAAAAARRRRQPRAENQKGGRTH